MSEFHARAGSVNDAAPTPRIRVPMLIHRTDLQSRFHRGLFGVLSALGWSAWLYLFAPLFGLLASELGYKAIDHDGLAVPHAALAGMYVAVILVESALLLAWAIYNLLRFRSNDRREPSSPVSLEDLVDLFQLGESQVARLHASRVVRLHHDAKGGISDIEVLDAATVDAPKSSVIAVVRHPQGPEPASGTNEWVRSMPCERAQRA